MDEEVRDAVGNLLAEQTLGVLATCREGSPYLNLVAFSPTADLTGIIFATGRATRKYENLSRNRRVSFLIDSRANRPEDFSRAAAVTALGETREIGGEEAEDSKNLYLQRHPHLKEFVSSPDTALFRLTVSTYILVRKFQQVDLLHPR